MNIVVMKHLGFESIPLQFQILVTHIVGNWRSVLIVTDLIEFNCQRKCDSIPIKDSNFLNNFGRWTIEKEKSNYITKAMSQ